MYPCSDAHTLTHMFHHSDFSIPQSFHTTPSTSDPSSEHGSMFSTTSTELDFTMPQPTDLSRSLSQSAFPAQIMDDLSVARAICDYILEARSKYSTNPAFFEVFSFEKPYLNLLFRQRQPDDAHSISNFVAELVGSITELDVRVKIAIAHMFTFLMRVCLPTTKYDLFNLLTIYYSG